MGRNLPVSQTRPDVDKRANQSSWFVMQEGLMVELVPR